MTDFCDMSRVEFASYAFKMGKKMGTRQRSLENKYGKDKSKWPQVAKDSLNRLLKEYNDAYSEWKVVNGSI